MASKSRDVLSLAILLPLGIISGNCKSKDIKSSPKEVTEPFKGITWDAATAAVADAAAFQLPPAPPLSATPLGLPTPPDPEYNPTTAEKVALGFQLFSDTAISMGGTLSCAVCHDPAHGYANAALFNKTATGNENQRHAPSLSNVAYHQEFYWDGRSQPLEAHILGHWKGQLGVAPEDAIDSISELPVYQAHFARSFEGAMDKDRAAEALAAFVRTRLNGNSPWDRYEAGDPNAVSADAIAGAKIFNKRSGCATCHAPPLYTDLKFHNLGLPQGEVPDVGRERHTGRPIDHGAFKTPSLRAVSQSPPYFHNGSANTLLQVLEHKETQGSPRLTAKERSQLLAFLAALTGDAAP